jgi:hypothetical protein
MYNSNALKRVVCEQVLRSDVIEPPEGTPISDMERLLDFWGRSDAWFGREHLTEPAGVIAAQKSAVAGAIRKQLLHILDHPHAIDLPPELAAESWLHIAAQLLVYADWFQYKK